jgi:hypothetical protein
MNITERIGPAVFAILPVGLLVLPADSGWVQLVAVALWTQAVLRVLVAAGLTYVGLKDPEGLALIMLNVRRPLGWGYLLVLFGAVVAAGFSGHVWLGVVSLLAGTAFYAAHTWGYEVRELVIEDALNAVAAENAASVVRGRATPGASEQGPSI